MPLRQLRDLNPSLYESLDVSSSVPENSNMLLNVKTQEPSSIKNDSFTTVSLSKGLETKVSVEDYDFIMRWSDSWSAAVQNNKFKNCYAVRKRRQDEESGPTTIYMHRVIYERHFGSIPEGMEVDHFDRDKLNNQYTNLRLATPSENHMNQSAHSASKVEGLGISIENGIYRASIKKDRRTIKLGSYGILDEAIAARDCKALELFGEYANINKPLSDYIKNSDGTYSPKVPFTPSSRFTHSNALQMAKAYKRKT